jgi:hypothetical protein
VTNVGKLLHPMMSALHAVHALEQGHLNIELKTCLFSLSLQNRVQRRSVFPTRDIFWLAFSHQKLKITLAIRSASNRGSQPRTGALALKLPQTSSLSHLQFPTTDGSHLPIDSTPALGYHPEHCVAAAFIALSFRGL